MELVAGCWKVGINCSNDIVDADRQIVSTNHLKKWVAESLETRLFDRQKSTKLEDGLAATAPHLESIFAMA